MVAIRALQRSELNDWVNQRAMRGAGSSFLVLGLYTLCFSSGVFCKQTLEKRPVHAKRSSRYLKAR